MVGDSTTKAGVLLTARLPATQGTELPFSVPLENSTQNGNDQCGQATNHVFFMELLARKPSTPDPAPPGSDCGYPFGEKGSDCCCPSDLNHGSTDCTFEGVWSYRRAAGIATMTTAKVGDISQQNWGSGNDLNIDYWAVPMTAAKASVDSNAWSGGTNLTMMPMLEQPAWGWVHTCFVSLS